MTELRPCEYCGKTAKSYVVVRCRCQDSRTIMIYCTSCAKTHNDAIKQGVSGGCDFCGD